MPSVLNHSEMFEDRKQTTPASQPARPSSFLNLPADESHDLANLDFLRTVAVILVFVDHLAAASELRGLGDIGRFGVLIFFVHTSLVLMLSMNRLRLSGLRLYIPFLIRRVFRIYPLSILSVVAVVLFRIPAINGAGGFGWIGWPGFLSNIFLIQNLTHSKSIDFLWSLPFEMQMYFVLPILYLLLTRFPSLKAASLLWLLGIAIACTEWALRHGTVSMDFSLTRYVPCFLAGVFAWRLMVSNPRRLPGFLWIVFLFLLVIAYRSVDALRVYGFGPFDVFHATVRTDRRIWWPHFLDLARDWIFCGATGLAFPFFREMRIGWLNGLTHKVARYSYGIYVAHVPVMWLCMDLLHPGSRLAGALLSVTITGALAILLYHLVEHPAIELGKRLSIDFTSIPAFR